jgi:hypothetical protein
MSYRFTVINTYWAFVKESESEFEKSRIRSWSFCVPTAQPRYFNGTLWAYVIMFLSFLCFFSSICLYVIAVCFLVCSVLYSAVGVRCADPPFMAGHSVEKLKQVADANPSRRYALPCVRNSGPFTNRALVLKCGQVQIYSTDIFGFRGNSETLLHTWT